MTTKRLRVWWEDVEISDEIELVNGKANPFGWSQYEIHYGGERIGWLESGCPSDFVEGFRFETEEIETPP